MIIQLKVFEQTLSVVSTNSVPRNGSKDYLVLHFLFSSDWDDLDKMCYLQCGEVSQPIDVVDGNVVHKDGAETIAGVKTFQNNIKVGSSSISTNGYIEGTLLKTTQASNSKGNFCTLIEHLMKY